STSEICEPRSCAPQTQHTQSVYNTQANAESRRCGVGVGVKACLNGARTREEHHAVPVTAAELARDALAARRAGAFAVHVHPRDGAGAETIEPDPFARASAIGAWRNPPDFVSVNVGEVGWAGTIRAALHAGIGVEAGLSSPADASE